MPITTAFRNTLRSVGQLSRRSKLRLAWDVFMVWVALVNLWMILFDFSYLWLRPVYARWTPVVTAVYDPVKGIETHPLTEAMLGQLDLTAEVIRTDPVSPAIPEHRDNLVRLTTRVVRENPFSRSGQGRTLGFVIDELARTIGVTPSALHDQQVLTEAAEAYWPEEPERMLLAIEAFSARVSDGLTLNYYRSFDAGGRLTDHFWIIDLPFLILFWIEFSVRWSLAVRRRAHARWFFFPIFNWYDVLGLIPVAGFRPFRLLRAVSMYMRLQRSELSSVGKDIFSRTVLYFSNIITEEVSDRVALRILSEFREEIEDGTHTRITRSVVEPRKIEIEEVLAAQIRQTITDPETLDRLRSLVRLNLANAVDESEALQAVPLPNVVLKPAVRAIGEVILDSTIETVTGTLDSPEGEEAIRGVADAVIDNVFYGPGLTQLESLVKEISLQVIDHMMDVVKVKKWALPEDDERRPAMPWEPGALDDVESSNDEL